MNGVPVGRIAWATIALIALFLIAGVVLDALGHDTEGANAIATATGIAIGATGATGVVVVTQKQQANDQQPDPPKPPT